MTIRSHALCGFVCACAALALAGCTKSRPPAAPAPTGRLVPAEVSGFERGAGGWRVSRGDATGLAPEVKTGEASLGNCWLDLGTVSLTTGEATFAATAPVDPLNWSRFGDMIRADVRIQPAAPNGATARLYAIRADGSEVMGTETAVGAAWTTLAWAPRVPLASIRTLGVRFVVKGPWNGSGGLDNVRVGASQGLSKAWSVVEGPFPDRAAATKRMSELSASGTESFPARVQGRWYVNLGTFRSETAAKAEAKRLTGQGLKASVVRR